MKGCLRAVRKGCEGVGWVLVEARGSRGEDLIEVGVMVVVTMVVYPLDEQGEGV